MHSEVESIKAKRDEEAQRIKEEEVKVLEAHKIAVQRKLRYSVAYTSQSHLYFQDWKESNSRERRHAG